MSKINSPEWSAYRSSIEVLAKTKSKKEFLNSGAVNAVSVLATIVRHANEEILIYSGNNKRGVTDSDEYVYEIEQFLAKKSGQVKVFLENGLKEENNFPVYQVLKEYRDKHNDSRVEIKDATKVFKEDVINVFDSNYHFTVADKRMFRVETGPVIFKAICSFNSTSTAKALRIFFMNHFQATHAS